MLRGVDVCNPSILDERARALGDWNNLTESAWRLATDVMDWRLVASRLLFRIPSNPFRRLTSNKARGVTAIFDM